MFSRAEGFNKKRGCVSGGDQDDKTLQRQGIEDLQVVRLHPCQFIPWLPRHDWLVWLQRLACN